MRSQCSDRRVVTRKNSPLFSSITCIVLHLRRGAAPSATSTTKIGRFSAYTAMAGVCGRYRRTSHTCNCSQGPAILGRTLGHETPEVEVSLLCCRCCPVCCNARGANAALIKPPAQHKFGAMIFGATCPAWAQWMMDYLCWRHTGTLLSLSNMPDLYAEATPSGAMHCHINAHKK